MRGRKPKPTAAKKVDGNPGKRRLRAAEPVMGPGVPQPPAYLGDEGRAEWFRKVAEMPPGFLTKVDDGTLGNYCLAFQNLCEARSDIEENGRYTVTNSGYESPRPAVADEKTAMLMMQRFGAELGFSPSSRVRLGTTEGDADDGSLEKFNAQAMRYVG